MIKAIETEWKGYLFRSRLEARWAVFFEKMGIEWRYEHEGYRIGNIQWLPDFEIKIGDQEFYVEVKGNPKFFADGVWIQNFDFGRGPPGFPNSLQTHPYKIADGSKPIILLGDIPNPVDGILFISILLHRKGVQHSRMAIGSGGYVFSDGSLLYSSYCGVNQTQEVFYGLDDFQAQIIPTRFCDRKVIHALACARKARFEYGEKP